MTASVGMKDDDVEQVHSIFYILQDYSSLTLVERRGDWVLEVVVVVREQETDHY